MRPSHVRLVLNAYMITSNTEGILALEAFARKKKPGLVPRFGVQFGIPYLLMKNPAASEAFFAGLLAEKGLVMRDWVKWNHAFSLVQQGKSEPAKSELIDVSGTAKDPIVRMLSLYLLDVFSRQDSGVEKRISDLRDGLRAQVPPATMNQRITKSGDNMEVVVLSKIVQDARDWLYAASEPAGPAAPVGTTTAEPSIE